MDINMKMFRKDEGFTLVELMVVVLIIGILVAIAIPVFNAARATAQARSCQSNQRVIEGAVQQYVAADPGNAEADCDGAVSGANPVMTYVQSAPECPFDGATYTLAAGVTACPSGTHAHYSTVN